MRSPIASGEQPAPKAVSAPQVRALPSTERTADLPGPATAFEFADIPSPADASAPRASTLFGGDDADERSRSGTKRWMLPGVAGGLIAGLAAAGLYVAQRSPAPAPGAGLGTLNLTSNPPGAQVFVDRQSKGQTTPVELMLRPGPHNIELRGIGEPRTIDVNVVAGSQTSQAVDLARTASAVERALSRTEPAGGQRSADASTRAQMPPAGAGQAPGVGAAGTADAPPAAAPVSGWVSVTAPVEVEVREHGSVLGTSHSDRIMVSAGRHQLEIVSEALGYRATAVVQVPAGKVAPVRIEWPKGTASVNAEPWAEVWIDGEKTGETPIGNLSLPIGPHEIVFRHPELGEQRYAVSISLKAPARVSVDMRKQP